MVVQQSADRSGHEVTHNDVIEASEEDDVDRQNAPLEEGGYAKMATTPRKVYLHNIKSCLAHRHPNQTRLTVNSVHGDLAVKQVP